MNFKISTASHQIPQVLDGISANTMFYLINKEKMTELYSVASVGEKSKSLSHLDLPHDIDDFSRCYLAWQTFEWVKKDYDIAIQNCKELKLEKRFIKFFENFFELTVLYSTRQEDKLYKLIKDYHN